MCSYEWLCGDSIYKHGSKEEGNQQEVSCSSKILISRSDASDNGAGTATAMIFIVFGKKS